MKDRILEVLAGINEDILVYEGENLFDAGLLDSFLTIDLVSELEEAFDVEIDAKYVVEENFKSVEAIVNMMQVILAEG